jgi:oxygen-independent coproporphyrinogen III oxidase
MSGIYIHIPFCKKACHYCNFHFSTSLKLKKPMLDAIKKELELRSGYLDNEIVETVYFGGGTPSILDTGDLMEIWDIVQKNYSLSSGLEVTLEANPDDLNLEKLKNLKDYTPINRFSIGIQSFHEADLQYMNRAHQSKEAFFCIENALKVGFNNLSVDLIYGTPTMNDEQWKYNLNTIFDFGIPHLSSYALTVEPKTALEHLIEKKKTVPVEEDHSARQFEILVESTSSKGYEHYEISNFCIPPHYSKHNTSYWLGKKYLGIGPSAHSFNGTSRQWNIANNAKYIEGYESKQPFFEIEELSEKEQFNEYIMTGLRTKFGIDLNLINQKWGQIIPNNFFDKIDSLSENELIIKKVEICTLSNQGKIISDSIIAELFL